MTRKQLIGRTLTEKELEQVSGGAASNYFYDSEGTPTGKVTGSYAINDNTPPDIIAGKIRGAVNLKQHAGP